MPSGFSKLRWPAATSVPALFENRARCLLPMGVRGIARSRLNTNRMIRVALSAPGRPLAISDTNWGAYAAAVVSAELWLALVSLRQRANVKDNIVITNGRSLGKNLSHIAKSPENYYKIICAKNSAENNYKIE